MPVIRAFIAFDLTPEIHKQIGQVLAQLRQRLNGAPVRWAPVENIHLTLKFLGDVSLANLDMLSPAGRLRQGWAALFPSRKHMVRRYRPKPGWLWPLCCPLKWAGMVLQAAAAVLRSVGLVSMPLKAAAEY